MRNFEGTVNQVYPQVVHAIMDTGAEVPSRNGPTKEIHPCFIGIRNPLQRLVTSWGRPVNVAFALAEVLWILQGRDDVAMLKHYNKRIDTWSDDGEVFNAPYGRRLRFTHGFDQIGDVVRTLRADPDSRQAVLNVWHPPSDRGYEPMDPPVFAVEGDPESEQMVQHKTADRACNMLCHLMIREGALNWLQVVRSNDVIWGLPYNLMQWSHLQEYIAGLVGVPVGKLYWLSDSMHMYGSLVPGSMDPNQPGVGGQTRWEDSKAIREFDLYRITGCHHAPMGATHFQALRQLGQIEEQLRENEVDSGQANIIIRNSGLSMYWRNVLSLLYGHTLYLSGEDEACIDLLAHCPDRVYALAQLRFYTHMRWGKQPGFKGVLEEYYRSDLVSWIMGQDPQVRLGS